MWSLRSRGRHRPKTETTRTLDSAAGTITAMGQAGPDLASDGSPKRPGSRLSWRVAHKQAKGATSGYVGEAVPLVETWEQARSWNLSPPSPWQQIVKRWTR